MEIANHLKKYHPAIIALLLSNSVGAIRGGGYMPENNFSLDDLTKEEQEMVLSKKPWLTKPEEFIKRRKRLISTKLQGTKQKEFETTLLEPGNKEKIAQAVRNIMTANVDIFDNEYTVGKKPPHPFRDPYVGKHVNFFLRNAYLARKKIKYDEAFYQWLDNIIHEMVKSFIELDMKYLDSLNQKNNQHKMFLFDFTNIGQLDQIIATLYRQQPALLRAAPKRNRFPTFEDYYEYLERFVQDNGYELPERGTDDNIVSYEFMVKAGQEVATQAQLFLKKVKDDGYQIFRNKLM